MNVRNKNLTLTINYSNSIKKKTVQPDSRVIRGCGWDDSNYKNQCYQRAGFGGRQEVCACETDNCNSSVSLKSTLMTLTVGLIAISGYCFRY